MADIKIEVKDSNEFKPIDIHLTLTLKAKEELQDILKEFEEGEFENFTTQYSGVLYEALSALYETCKTL